MHTSSGRAVFSEVISSLVKYVYMALLPTTHLCELTLSALHLRVRRKLSAASPMPCLPVCLPAAMLPAMMVMGSNPFELPWALTLLNCEPELNALFSKLPQPCVLVQQQTAVETASSLSSTACSCATATAAMSSCGPVTSEDTVLYQSFPLGLFPCSLP